MASVTYGKSIMSSVIMAKILWQMKLSQNIIFNKIPLAQEWILPILYELL